MNPKVTVFVAFRNREKFIRGCLDSLVNQTIVDETEIIAIDNNSQENEKKVVRQYQKRCPSLKYIFAKKEGLYHAWNVGIKASKGKYITNLNSDDRLRSDALEIMAKALDDNPEVALVYGNSYVTNVPNETFEENYGRSRRLNWPEYSHKELLLYCICGPHPMWRRKVHKEVGYFDETYKISGDYEFWLRIAEKYKMMRIAKMIGLYYENREGLSLSDIKKTRREIRRAQLEYFNSK